MGGERWGLNNELLPAPFHFGKSKSGNKGFIDVGTVGFSFLGTLANPDCNGVERPSFILKKSACTTLITLGKSAEGVVVCVHASRLAP